MLLVLIQSVPVVRLECTDGALLRAQCSSVSMVRCEGIIKFNKINTKTIPCNLVLHAVLKSCIFFIPAFLLHESPPGLVRIRCGHPATSYSWSKSDDGSAANAVILDTSSDKYTVVDGNSLDISLYNVTGDDGGLYRCVYDEPGRQLLELGLCVYVLWYVSQYAVMYIVFIYIISYYNHYKSKCQV